MSKQYFKNLAAIVAEGIISALKYDWQAYSDKKFSECVLTYERLTAKWAITEHGLACVNKEYLSPNGSVPIFDIFGIDYKSKQSVHYQQTNSNFEK